MRASNPTGLGRRPTGICWSSFPLDTWSTVTRPGFGRLSQGPTAMPVTHSRVPCAISSMGRGLLVVPNGMVRISLPVLASST